MRQLWALFALLVVSFGAGADDKRFEGHVDLGAQGKLKIIWHVSADDDGRLKSFTMDIPQQGGVGIAASGALLEGNSLTVDFAVLGGQFLGTKTDDGFAGSFTQAGQKFAFSVTEVALKAASARPAAPKITFTGPQVDLEIPAGDLAPIRGTLYLPASDGPHPVVVLLSGSGPQDRRAEVVRGFEIFTQFAAHLTQHNIAVFAYDDRDFDKGPAFGKLTSLDHARDGATALAFLKKRSDIDASRTAYLGHSEGGQNEAIAHVRFEPASHIVNVAGTSVDLGAVLIHQKALQAKVAGAPDAAIKAQSLALQVLVAGAGFELEADRRRALAEAMDEIALPDAARAANMAFFNTQWIYWASTYNPATDWSQVKVPVLGVYGSKDLQVDPAQNIPPLKQALAGNADVTITTLDGLNHLMQKATTGLPTEYGSLKPEIDPSALTAISNWLVKQWGL